MDGKTFDALIKQTATSTGRRRLVQAVAAAGLGGFVSRRGTAAGDVGTEACKRRQGSCDGDGSASASAVARNSKTSLAIG